MGLNGYDPFKSLSWHEELRKQQSKPSLFRVLRCLSERSMKTPKLLSVGQRPLLDDKLPFLLLFSVTPCLRGVLLVLIPNVQRTQ